MQWCTHLLDKVGHEAFTSACSSVFLCYLLISSMGFCRLHSDFRLVYSYVEQLCHSTIMVPYYHVLQCHIDRLLFVS